MKQFWKDAQLKTQMNGKYRQNDYKQIKYVIGRQKQKVLKRGGNRKAQQCIGVCITNV